MLVTSIGLFGVVAMGAALPQHDSPPTTLVTATRSKGVVATSTIDLKILSSTVRDVDPLMTPPPHVPDFNDVSICVGTCIDASYVCLTNAGPAQCEDEFFQCKLDCFSILSTPSDAPVSQPAKRQITNTVQSPHNAVCVTDCMAHYNVCLAGGHADSYCGSTANACFHQCPSPKEADNAGIPKRQVTQQTIQQCESNCEAQWDVCFAGGHTREHCDSITWQCWFACPIAKLGDVKEVSKRQDQCAENCIAQLGTCLQGGHHPDYCQLIFDACQYQCDLGKTGNEVVVKRQELVIVLPEPKSEAQKQCVDNCEAQYKICRKGEHDPKYCLTITNACIKQCPESPAKELQAAKILEKRQVVDPRRQCINNCNAQYDVCMAGGHDIDYCIDDAQACYAQCPESAAKAWDESFDIEKRQTLETTVQCILNCSMQYDICKKGGHTTEHCAKITAACQNQCPVAENPKEREESKEVLERQLPPVEHLKRQVETPECDQCYTGLLTCLETDHILTCSPAYEHCLEVNACSLVPLAAPPRIPEPAFPPVEEREPAKRAGAKDCQQCEHEWLVCVDNRGPFQPLDQTCGFPYRQCLATCTPPPPPPSAKRDTVKDCQVCEQEYQTCIDNRLSFQPLDIACGIPYRACLATCTAPPPPPPAPVRRNEAVDCNECDRQAKFCIDSRGPAIHALDIVCGIPHRQCLATCTRPHSDNSVCVKNGIEFEC